MNNLRITRSLAKSDEELRREVEAFDPFVCNKSIPRGDSEEEINEKLQVSRNQKRPRRPFANPRQAQSE